MSERTKGVMFLAVLILIAAGAGTLWYRQRSMAKTHQERVKQETQVRITALVQKHNAIVGWESNLPDRHILGTHFTLDLSRLLVNTNRQAVLFSEASLIDVVEGQLGFLVYFTQSFDDVDATLILQCSQEQVAQLTQWKGSEATRYAVVAVIDNVSRSRIISTEVDPEGDAFAVDSSKFQMKGRCVEFVRFGD